MNLAEENQQENVRGNGIMSSSSKYGRNIEDSEGNRS